MKRAVVVFLAWFPPLVTGGRKGCWQVQRNTLQPVRGMSRLAPLMGNGEAPRLVGGSKLQCAEGNCMGQLINMG